MILLRETPERNYWLLEPGEAPLIEPCDRLVLDVETSSGARDEEGLYAYYSRCKLAGYAFSIDGVNFFYVSIAHRDCECNWEPRHALQLILDLFAAAKTWANHNIKFDAHFIAVALEREGMLPNRWMYEGTWYDTKSMAQIIDSDKFRYGLKDLAREMMGCNTSTQDVVKQWLKDAKTKDYGDVPADLVGEYACDDVAYVWDLYDFFEREMPSQSRGIQRTEILLTPVLWDMERAGMVVDRNQLETEHVKALRSTVMACDEIEKLTGREFTNSSECLFDTICVQLGLPVLERTEKGNPSFEADVLTMYRGLPEVVVDPTKTRVLDLIASYRHDATFLSLFVETFKRYITPESPRLHPDYNQIVRTGRLSCSRPNAQQQNERSKALIAPDDSSCGFLSCDASQIELRLIVHYCEDIDAITAYSSFPRTDFHQWMATQSGADRSLAKALNFAVSFGAGKNRTLTMLISAEAIVDSMGKKVDDLIARGLLKPEERMKRFATLVQQRATEVYNAYHSKFPNLKPTSNQATVVAKARGYVFNAYGRRRHLHPQRAHIAFNSVVQGSAADFIKNRMVAVAPRYNQELRSAGIDLRINVHDELVFHGDTNVLLQFEPRINELLEIQDPVRFRVPLIWNTGVSSKSWAAAGAMAKKNVKIKDAQAKALVGGD